MCQFHQPEKPTITLLTGEQCSRGIELTAAAVVIRTYSF
jgi:hypothetical protein